MPLAVKYLHCCVDKVAYIYEEIWLYILSRTWTRTQHPLGYCTLITKSKPGKTLLHKFSESSEKTMMLIFFFFFSSSPFCNLLVLRITFPKKKKLLPQILNYIYIHQAVVSSQICINRDLDLFIFTSSFILICSSSRYKALSL